MHRNQSRSWRTSFVYIFQVWANEPGCTISRRNAFLDSEHPCHHITKYLDKGILADKVNCSPIIWLDVTSSLGVELIKVDTVLLVVCTWDLYLAKDICNCILEVVKSKQGFGCHVRSTINIKRVALWGHVLMPLSQTPHRTPLKRVSQGSLFRLSRSGAYPDAPYGLGFIEPALAEFVDETEALQTNVEGLSNLSESLATFNESFASWLYVMNMNALTTDWPQVWSLSLLKKRNNTVSRRRHQILTHLQRGELVKSLR